MPFSVKVRLPNSVLHRMTDKAPKQLAILGSTGSIGTQTLELVRRFPERFRAAALVAGRRVDNLIAQALEFRPDIAVIADSTLYPQLREALAPHGIATAAGAEAIEQVVAAGNIDMVVTATVGYSGLAPTLAAIRAGKDIALANKETLVVAGELVTRMLRNSDSRIFPVDSEHSAIFQCLQGEDINSVNRLIITASGGPFRTWDTERIAKATAADALHHPNWSMGAKITIDSATMVNKAFEIIEAHWLFGLPADRIEAIVHPQSIIHSMVEFRDGAIKAQMGVPDMTIPIAYALDETGRMKHVSDFCSLLQHNTLTFEQPDTAKFPGLTLAYRALNEGGNLACVINAANEVAVNAFLHGQISFPDIYSTIVATCERASRIESPSYDDYVASNSEARRIALEIIS